MALPDKPVSTGKERKPFLPRPLPEKHPVVERPEKIEAEGIPEEIEKIESVSEEDLTLAAPVTDDTGAVIVDTPAPRQVKITLPLTEEEIDRALHAKIIYSFRWLAEWSKRLLKKIGGRLVYQPAGKFSQ